VKRRTYLLLRSLRAFAFRHEPYGRDPYWRPIWARHLRRIRRLGGANEWREQHIRHAEELGF
jgi:hypothetical protein